VRELDGTVQQTVELDRPVADASTNATGSGSVAIAENAVTEADSAGAGTYQSEMDRLMPYLYGTDTESDDGSDREDSNVSSNRSEKIQLNRTRRGADENDVDEETTAGDIDVEATGVTSRLSQGLLSLQHQSTHGLFLDMDESDADADDSFEYPQGNSDLLALFDELQIISSPESSDIPRATIECQSAPLSLMAAVETSSQAPTSSTVGTSSNVTGNDASASLPAASVLSKSESQLNSIRMTPMGIPLPAHSGSAQQLTVVEEADTLHAGQGSTNENK